MTTRHVLDTILDDHGDPVASATVSFRLTKASYTGPAAYTVTPVTVTTGVDGSYDAELWCDEEGAIATRHEATYPDGTKFKFDLPVGDGTPVLMSSLRTAAPAVPAISLQTYVDIAQASLQLIDIDEGTPFTVYGVTTIDIDEGSP
jgi:hypothetical protein